MSDVRTVQRALIMQGGGALGAYEAGVFNALYKRLIEKDKQDGHKGRPLFDIVAGTSAGAMNAAFLVSFVKKNKTWIGSGEKLVEFWTRRLSCPTPPLVELSTAWLDEAARRYYSVKDFFYNGVENLFSGPNNIFDFRFFDNSIFPNNIWFLYNNQPLRQSLQDFIGFPISTSAEEKEPRLLMTSVDVENGRTVTFDSYAKETVCEHDTESKEYESVLKHEDGLRVEQVMASGSVPVHFDYEKIGNRKFWDGGILSNTPIRELLQEHRDYWYKIRGVNVPNLELYIVDLWPSKKSPVPTDYDGVKDRKKDIMYSDKTNYDQKVSNMVSDYVTLVKNLISFATSKGITQDEIDSAVLSKNVMYTTKRSGAKRKYSDLLNGRFHLEKVVTIERKDDKNSISNKWADYTAKTIKELISLGEKDAEKARL